MTAQRNNMSTELGIIDKSGTNGVQLQITQFDGPADLGLMLQLTQGLGFELDDSGFIQLTRKDVEELIPVLLSWLNTTDPPQSGFAHWAQVYWKYGSSTDLVKARRAFEAAGSDRGIPIAGTS
jgi:hypothetical protein